MSARTIALMSDTWVGYLASVTEGMSQAEIAEAAGIDPSGVSRWMSGKTKMPSAEKVVHFARKMGLPPIVALIKAGYLTVDEAGAVEVAQSVSALSDAALVDELRGRLGRLRAAADEGEGHYMGGLPSFGEETGVDGDENTDKRQQFGSG